VIELKGEGTMTEPMMTEAMLAAALRLALRWRPYYRRVLRTLCGQP
jgi:hypothetical protein